MIFGRINDSFAMKSKSISEHSWQPEIKNHSAKTENVNFNTKSVHFPHFAVNEND